jgi:hypothetical protein
MFREQICELATRFHGPVFEPHVTIFIAPGNSRNPAEILREVGAGTIELTIRNIRLSDEFTKTLFVQFENSHALQELGDRIWRASGAPARQILDPHLSLLYANLSSDMKQKVADQITFPFRAVRFRSICAVRCARPTTCKAEVEDWRLIAPQ